MCVIKEKLWCRSGFREDFPGCMTLVRTKLDSFCPSGDSRYLRTSVFPVLITCSRIYKTL